MSTHAVRVIRIQDVVPHPNADRLDLVTVGRYVVASQRDAFKVGDLAVHVEPDYVVLGEGPFEFLGPGPQRIKTRKLRGVWSEGLLIPAPPDAQEGDDVMKQLGITRYEPPMKFVGGGTPGGVAAGLAESVPEPLRLLPKYDLENIKHFPDVFNTGELVYVTEKLHGCNARFCYWEGKMYAGGRTQWRKQEPKNVYWEAAAQNPWIEEWCKAHEGMVLYGEAFGAVQDLTYGAKSGQVMFRAFDITDLWGHWCASGFLNSADFRRILHRHPDAVEVPLVAHMHFDLKTLEELAEQASSIGGGIREGLVIKPAHERLHPKLGRVALKMVSKKYLSR